MEQAHPARVRLDHLDALRVALILLVVAHHAAQPYGPPDWWYFRGDRRTGVLAAFSAVNGAFFMSLFFFVSAVLVPAARDARGTRAFVRNRLRRLGFGERPADWTGPSWPDLQFGHLWFLQHLLVYSLLYAFGRWLVERARALRGAATRLRPMRAPRHGDLLAFTLAVALATFAIRLRYPLDSWVPLFGFLQAEPARMAQYVAWFAVGIVAARCGWLERLPASTAYPWLALGVSLAALPFLAGGIAALGFDGGGPSRAALAGAAWESFVCTGLCVGLVVLFRERFAVGHAVLRSLSASSYAVYILHVPIVVALQFALAPADLAPLGAFAVVAASAIPLSFAAAEGLRRLPGFRSVL